MNSSKIDLMVLFAKCVSNRCDQIFINLFNEKPSIQKIKEKVLKNFQFLI